MPWPILGSLCPLRLVLGTFFPLLFIDSGTISIDFRHFFRRIRRAASEQKPEIRERSAPGDHPKKHFLQSTNHIYFAPRDFDDR